MKNKLLSMGILVVMAMMYPFSCTPQTGIGVGNGNGCDTVFIENPQLGEFQKELQRLRKENGEQQTEINTLTTANTGLKTTVATQTTTIASKDSEIKDLGTTIKEKNTEITALGTANAEKDATIGELETANAEKDAYITELENRPPVTVTDTIYKEKDFITVAGVEYKVSDIELIRPFEEVDEVVITHCADSTKNTTWFHWGGISGYPHDISMASKEYGMIKIHFKDSLTDEIKVQKSYTLKRIKDYTNAETKYEFIK